MTHKKKENIFVGVMIFLNFAILAIAWKTTNMFSLSIEESTAFMISWFQVS